MINNLEYYKVFYYVAKLGSVTKAANELAISQPAVSQAMKQLERNLGVALIKRASRGIQLTKEGQELYGFVEKGYHQMELGEDRIHRMQNLEAGEIRIGASDMTLQFYLLPYLEKFHERYPQIKVIVTNAPTPETLQLLRDGKIDFCVVSTPFEEKDDLCTVKVREIEDVFVAGRRFLHYKNKTMDFQELEELPMICLERNTSTRSYMDTFLGENNVSVMPEFELATSDMIVQFALRNLGVGCVVRDFAKDYLDNGQLFELRFNKMIPKRQFCVAYSNKSKKLPVTVKRLFEIMEIG